MCSHGLIIKVIQFLLNNSFFKMKRIFLGFLLTILTACGDSVSLGGKYYLNRSDWDRVYILKETPEGLQAIIGGHVVDWKRLDNYSVLLRKVATSPDCYDKNGIPTIVTHYTDKSEFWILNVSSGIEYGPFNIEQYKLKLTQLGLPFVTLQVPSSYKANTAYYNESTKNCKIRDIEK